MDTHTQRKNASLGLKDAIEFFNQVKIRFQHRRRDYKLFLDTLRSFQDDHNLDYKVNVVASIFDGHSDLLKTFLDFLSYSKLYPKILLSPSLSASEDHRHAFNSLANEGRSFLREVGLRLDSAQYSEFVKVIKRCRMRGLDRSESRREITRFIGEFGDLMDAYERYWDETAEIKASLNGDCGPSYHRRPSKRQKLDAQAPQVLNDNWECLSVSNVSGNSRGNHGVRRGEELQDELEDQRYEMDMMLQYLTITAERAEDLLEKMKSDMNLKTPIQVEDHFSSSNLRCIEQLYGEQGYQVRVMLCEDPIRVLPTLLKRLRQKKECLKRHLELRNADANMKTHEQ